MKKIFFSFMTIVVMMLFMPACIKEAIIQTPEISEVLVMTTDKEGNLLPVSTVSANQTVMFIIKTDAEMVSIWPGGMRKVMRKKFSDQDSIDMFGHPVLEISDNYNDYGLVKARGVNTSLNDDGDWYATYTYSESGVYTLNVVATNHGLYGYDLERVIYDAGDIIVNE